ncbi:MAG: methyltransferase domain-containing protein [Arcobacteraceae bacterium]|nr:methyltransferase domain-containing protein [Arcobacteraceae bacterium]
MTNIMKNLEPYTKVVVYGNGLIGRQIINELGDKVVGIIDRNINAINKSNNIYPPSELCNIECDIVLITVMDTNREHIKNYLVKVLNIPDSKIMMLKPFTLLEKVYIKLNSRFKYYVDTVKAYIINFINKLLGYKYLNIGSGFGANQIGWWTGDYQEGFIIDANTKLPFKDDSITFVYSSMFFEHITDEVAYNLLNEIYRVMKKGSVLRIVVPNFSLYIDKYKNSDFDFFYNPNNDNYETWQRFNVPINMESLLISYISQLDNMDIEIVYYPHLENINSVPPKVYYRNRLMLQNYYCGPAPEIDLNDVKSKVLEQPKEEFINWVFNKTLSSQYRRREFVTWHKNQWDYDKFVSITKQIGFSNVEVSDFGDSHIKLDCNIEKPHHKRIGMYFNIIK